MINVITADDHALIRKGLHHSRQRPSAFNMNLGTNAVQAMEEDGGILRFYCFPSPYL